MTERPATAAEVRAHYQGAGYSVRIAQDGRVTYRADAVGPWLEGRWVEEYRVSAEYGVRLK
jgi:hypothetical protein